MLVKTVQASIIAFNGIHCEESRDLNTFYILVPTLRLELSRDLHVALSSKESLSVA